MRIHFWIGILLIAITLMVTAVLYPRLPSNIPIHWNVHGVADNYGPKWLLLVINPGVMAGLLAGGASFAVFQRVRPLSS
jgi:uncharacterized membrane protein